MKLMNVHVPLRSTSCNRRHETANDGMKTASWNMPRTAPQESAMTTASRKPADSRLSAPRLLRVRRADETRNAVSVHHQNSLRLARPRNVAYLRKNLRIASCQDAPYSGSSRGGRDPGGVAGVMG